MMKTQRTFSIGAIGATLAILFSIAGTAHAATIPLATIQSGDLVRGETSSSVYYFGEDGMRYVFPNEKTYFSWYTDFKNVKWISDADLAKIQIGGNVTYRPGSKLISFAGDAHMYAVGKNGGLRSIMSEAIAKELYGNAWKTKTDIIPDGFFKNYHLEGTIEFASQYSPASEQKEDVSINADKSLHPATLVHMTRDGYADPTIYILSGHAVRWINDDTTNHSASEWDGIWGSGTLKPGDTFTKRFVERGTWSYYSTYDEKSKVGGAIVVE